MPPKHGSKKGPSTQKSISQNILALTDDDEAMGKKAADAIRNHLSQLKKEGNATPWENYKQLSSNKQRKEFALKLQVDPAGSFCTVSSSSSVTHSNETGAIMDWMSIFEVADVEKIPFCEQNKDILQKLVSKAPSRPHENEALAADGHKQYWWNKRLHVF